MKPIKSVPLKTILLPLGLMVDVSNLLPLIQSPAFQRLRYVKQLGNLFRIYPGAVHSRFEHSLGTLYWTDRILAHMQLTDREKNMIRVYALLHDIGHGPYSHETEALLRADHHQRFFHQVDRLQDPLAACGIDVPRFLHFLAHAPAYKDIVDNRNIGADKIDYLVRDAQHIGFKGAPSLESLVKYTTIKENRYVVEEKCMEEVKRLQHFYAYLHKNGYLNKTSIVLERMFARAVAHLLAGGELSEHRLWSMHDWELDHHLRASEHPICRTMMSRLDRRDLFVTALVVRPHSHVYLERIAHKPIHVCGMDLERIQALFAHFRHSARNLALEEELEDRLDLQRGSLVVAFSPHMDRLRPRDLYLYRQQSNDVLSLRDLDPSHYRVLEQEYLASLSIRIGVARPFRAALAAEHQAVLARLTGGL